MATDYKPELTKLPFMVHNVSVDGIDLFYREAGNPNKPTILLLHGYPSSSHQYRHLIPILAECYHVLAPDYPGFGFTNVPEARNYTYTFDSVAHTISEWLKKLNVDKMVIYIFDYGAPVGFRLALQQPESIRAIVTQNGNAYLEGIGPLISPLVDYFNDPTNATAIQNARSFVTYDATKAQYTDGAPDPSVIEPESYTLDAALLARPGNVDIQLGFFRDYKTNLAAYPKWHEYLRKYQPPVLAVWGKNDQHFISPGASAYQQDVPTAEIQLIDGTHFLLETSVTLVGQYMLDFMARKGI